MSRPPDHSDEIRELIRRVLEEEETGEDRAFLEAHPEVTAEVEDIRRSRRLLAGAVDRIELPDRLAARVQAQTIDAEEPTDEPSETASPDDPEQQERFLGNTSFWIYSMVASLLFAIMIWGAVGLFDGDSGEGTEEERIASGDTGTGRSPSDRTTDGGTTDGLRPVGEVLQVGMTDHIRCAITFYSGDIPPAPMEKMKMGVGEGFEDLIPVVEEGIDPAHLVVAHRCSFEGREYIHLVLKGEGDTLVSVAITERREGERLQDRADADTVVDGRSIFRTEIDGFEIAGFESGDYLVFVASNLSVEQNLRTIGSIVGGVNRVLSL